MAGGGLHQLLRISNFADYCCSIYIFLPALSVRLFLSLSSSVSVYISLIVIPLSSCPSLCRDKRHVEWVRSYLSIWTELQAFIKQHHTTGLVWSKTVSSFHNIVTKQ